MKVEEGGGSRHQTGSSERSRVPADDAVLTGTSGIRPQVINVDGHPAYARAIAELRAKGVGRSQSTLSVFGQTMAAPGELFPMCSSGGLSPFSVSGRAINHNYRTTPFHTIGL
jgi:hypothetical protein